MSSHSAVSCRRWRRRSTVWAAVLALALVGMTSSAVQAQPAPPPAAAPVAALWEQWFAALNGGDVAGVRALMMTEVAVPTGADAAVPGSDPLPRCASGCAGMVALEAAVAQLVADGYRGTIDPASVFLAGTTVSFAVDESSGTPPDEARTTSQWTMELELDGTLIAPACDGVCLRSPTARAALVAAQPVVTVALPAMPTRVPPPAFVAPRVLPPVALPPPAHVPVGGVTDARVVLWMMAGLLAGLLVLVGSAGHESWRRLRH